MTNKPKKNKEMRRVRLLFFSKSCFIPIYPPYQRRITDAIWMSSFKYDKLFP